jgi:hypothetical protein
MLTNLDHLKIDCECAFDLTGSQGAAALQRSDRHSRGFAACVPRPARAAQHFRRLLDVSPSEYRTTFSGRS